jgi:hypothetical protein
MTPHCLPSSVMKFVLPYRPFEFRITALPGFSVTVKRV